MLVRTVMLFMVTVAPVRRRHHLHLHPHPGVLEPQLAGGGLLIIL